jgi:hypothetical protein
VIERGNGGEGGRTFWFFFLKKILGVCLGHFGSFLLDIYIYIIINLFFCKMLSVLDSCAQEKVVQKRQNTHVVVYINFND